MNLFKIKIKNTTYGVSFSFFFVVALVSVCSGTQADMLFVTLMCCALHELGHLVLMTAFGSSPQEIVVYGGGIRITPDNKQLSKYHELAVLFGGAAVNFALCLLTYLTNGGGFFCQVNFLLGAQTKVLHFVENVRVVKDNLFPVPPLFKTIQEQSGTDWAEMYKVFNMGHRLEVYLSPEHAEEVIAISESFGIPAQIVGRIEACEQTELIIKSEFGEFRY
jgi:hypothetical protein